MTEMNAEDSSESGGDVRKNVFFSPSTFRVLWRRNGMALILIPRSPATQDFKPRKTTRETRGHVITHTRSREEKSGPSFSRGRGMASWWGTGKKKFFSFSLEVFKGFVEDDETININR